MSRSGLRHLWWGSQLLEVELDPGEMVVAEAGAMTYMGSDIAMEAKLGDGADADEGFFGKLFSAGKRMMTGESLFMTHFTNEEHKKDRVAFGAPFPGTVVPINMAAYADTIICQKDAFLAAALGTDLDIEFHKEIGAGFFGGEGFILQRIQGDGMVFLHAGGTLIEKTLNNETLKVDSGSLVGFTKGVDYSVEWNGSIRSALFSGEGVALTTLSGTGTVWLQSLPFPRLVDRIHAALPKPPKSSANNDCPGTQAGVRTRRRSSFHFSPLWTVPSNLGTLRSRRGRCL